MKSDKPYIVNGERVSLEEYRKTKFEDLRVRVPIGKKQTIVAHASKYSKSINAFINEAIDEKMERDNEKEAAPD